MGASSIYPNLHFIFDNNFATLQMAPVSLLVPVSLALPVSLVAPVSLGLGFNLGSET